GAANVKVNEPIAVLVEQGEAVPDSAPAPKAAPAPAAEAKAEAPAPAPAAAPASAASHEAPSHGDRVVASPLARRVAEVAGDRPGWGKGHRAGWADRAGGCRGGSGWRCCEAGGGACSGGSGGSPGRSACGEGGIHYSAAPVGAA